MSYIEASWEMRTQRKSDLFDMVEMEEEGADSSFRSFRAAADVRHTAYLYNLFFIFYISLFLNRDLLGIYICLIGLYCICKAKCVCLLMLFLICTDLTVAICESWGHM